MPYVRAFCFLITALLAWTGAIAQTLPKSESAQYWDQRGRHLVAGGQYAAAYSAFQLARSLGAPGMVPRMEDARRKNINQILLQSLLADARSLTESDPVQSLRLLEHAHRHFPDSSRILQQAGELVNQPNLWLHSLKASQIWPSSGLHYVVAALGPARLFACQGDSLTTLYTFDSPVEDVFFSPDERYVWVATQAGSWLLDCRQRPVRVVNRRPEIVIRAVFAADGHYVMANFWNDQTTRLWQVRAGNLQPTDVKPSGSKQWGFSPDGYYLYSLKSNEQGTTGHLYHLPDDNPKLVYTLTANRPLTAFSFSPDSRYLLVEGEAENSVMLARLNPSALNTRLFSDCYTDRLSDAFSANSQWLLLSFINADHDSLWAVSTGDLRLHHVFRPPSGAPGVSLRVLSRFSPEGSWLLRSSVSPRPEAQCWSLRGPAPALLHQFTNKASIHNDLFSANGRYLLAQHSRSVGDSLWFCTDAGLRPVHGFQTQLRTPAPDWPGAVRYPALSDDGHLLITYHTGATSDSLWQVSPTQLTPLYGFRERLMPMATVFSADGRWLLSGETESAPKTLYNTALLWPLHEPQLQRPLVDARFSASGQYLLGRSTASDSATVLYREGGGQLKLVQKLTLPFAIGESRFLNNDRHLFTYHQSGAASGMNRFASYLWRVTDNGLEPFFRFRAPILQIDYPRGGIPSQRLRNQTVTRGLLVAPRGQFLLTQPINGESDSLWQLGDTWQRLDGFEQTLPLYRTGNTDSLQSDYVLPEAGFVGDYLWRTRASDSTVTLQSLRPTGRSAYQLPAGVSELMAFSPQTGHAVFTLKTNEIPVLYQWQAGRWQPLRALPKRTYALLNVAWPDESPPNLISPDGRLLFAKDPDRMWLYRLSGAGVTLLTNRSGTFRTFAFVPAVSGKDQTDGALFSNFSETFWARERPGGCRVSRVGEGVLHQPPVSRNGLLYVARQLTDGRVDLDVLEQATGVRLAHMMVRGLLTLTVRPDGTVWAVTRAGFRVLHIPAERLRWLRRAAVAELSPGFLRNYSFN